MLSASFPGACVRVGAGRAGSGTRIILHLKEDCDEYLEDYKIKELLRKYSEFIQFPISVGIQGTQASYQHRQHNTHSGGQTTDSLCRWCNDCVCCLCAGVVREGRL